MSANGGIAIQSERDCQPGPISLTNGEPELKIAFSLDTLTFFPLVLMPPFFFKFILSLLISLAEIGVYSWGVPH